jgi:hypothetical protein
MAAEGCVIEGNGVRRASRSTSATLWLESSGLDCDLSVSSLFLDEAKKPRWACREKQNTGCFGGERRTSWSNSGGAQPVLYGRGTGPGKGGGANNGRESTVLSGDSLASNAVAGTSESIWVDQQLCFNAAGENKGATLVSIRGTVETREQEERKEATIEMVEESASLESYQGKGAWS